MRRARPQGGMRGRLDQLHREEKQQLRGRDLRLLLDHKPCLVHGPYPAPMGREAGWVTRKVA